MDHRINIVEHINEILEKRMEDGLVAYAIAHSIDVNYISFAITIAHEHDVICGVLNA